MESMKILVPNGHLSYAMSEEESFKLGLKEKPDAIAADAGSADIGPYPLGAGHGASPDEWQIHDIEMMLLAARKLKIPMVIGSCNDTGTNWGTKKFARIIRELARKHKLSPFKLATIKHTLTKERLRQEIQSGGKICGLDGREDLTMKELEATTQIVPVMGVEPYLEALNRRADVIMAARSSDCAIFASLALWKGFPKNVAYYAGKVLECASFCAEPYGAKESVMGIITKDNVSVKAMHPGQRCTPASLASHAMYERANPYFEKVAGGEIDMRECKYEQVDEKTTKVTGMEFNEADEYWVKIEGSAYVGERRYVFVGIRDPETIANIDKAMDWARGYVKKYYGKKDYDLFYHVYGRDGVLGEREPVRDVKAHEFGIIVEAVSTDTRLARNIATLGARGLFYARLPTKGTAGGAAVMSEDILAAAPVYRWSINHIMKIQNPMGLWKVRIETVDARQWK